MYHDDEACLPQCSKCQTSVHPNDVDEETAENIRNLEEKKEKEVQVKESLVTMQGHYAETSTEYAEVAGQILQAETKIASFDRRIDRQREKAGPPFLIVAGPCHGGGGGVQRRAGGWIEGGGGFADRNSLFAWHAPLMPAFLRLPFLMSPLSRPHVPLAVFHLRNLQRHHFQHGLHFPGRGHAGLHQLLPS